MASSIASSKDNHVYEFIAYLLVKLPEARFVYLTRVPREVALSWRARGAHAGGIVAGARQWKWDRQRFLGDYAIVQRMGRQYRICFEEFLSRASEVLGGITGDLCCASSGICRRIMRTELIVQYEDVVRDVLGESRRCMRTAECLRRPPGMSLRRRASYAGIRIYMPCSRRAPWSTRGGRNCRGTLATRSSSRSSGPA